MTPTGQGLGIIDSIQRELDLRRTMINDSSDEGRQPGGGNEQTGSESASDDDSESWSD